MAANYNNVAWFYDRVSRMVFGNQLLRAQEFLLDYIPPDSRILIAGGGTGRILELLTRKHKTGLTIIYAEVSAKMIALSKKKDTGGNKVMFITGLAEEANYEQAFDIILTPFLLDNFTNSDLHHFIEKINVHLKSGGLWLCTDFQLTGRWWQLLLLKSMYIFFKVLGCVSITKLPDIASAFQKAKYRSWIQKNFYSDFINAVVYQKE